VPETLLALVDLTLMQSGLIRELLADEDSVQIVDVPATELAATPADAVIGSAGALGERQVCELLERRPRLRALVMRGDLSDASLYLLKPEREHFGDISKAVLRRVVAPRTCTDWNP
jgi:hypothetical protein